MSRVDEVREMAEWGMSDGSIAEALGVPLGTAQRYRRRAGVVRGVGGGARRTREEFERMKGLLEEGMSCAAVATVIGCSANTVRAHFPEYVWGVEQKTKFAIDVRRGYERIDRMTKGRRREYLASPLRPDLRLGPKETQ